MNTRLQIPKFLLITISILTATFARAEQEGDFTYSIVDKAVTITKYTGASGVAKIPETIAGLPVVTIGLRAFSKMVNLKSVTIPRSVTTIENWAFHGCTALTEVTIPSSIQDMGGRAFLGCASLTKVVFEPGVTHVGAWAFQDCIKLTNVSFPSSIKNLENMAFYGCKSLVSATFEGNAPVLINKNEFMDTGAGFKILYYKGSIGFTTPEWNGYRTVEMTQKPKSK